MNQNTFRYPAAAAATATDFTATAAAVDRHHCHETDKSIHRITHEHTHTRNTARQVDL